MSNPRTSLTETKVGDVPKIRSSRRRHKTNAGTTGSETIGRSPPVNLLPPFRPPPEESLIAIDDRRVKLPALTRKCHLTVSSQKQLQWGCHKRRPGRAVKTGQSGRCDAATSTEIPDEYVCRLCGLNCRYGSLLYAHLIILIHGGTASAVTGEAHTKFTCRRCGRRWSEDAKWFEVNRHGCVQQKAAHLDRFIFPRDQIRQGLPFVCLFCCAEPEPGRFPPNASVRRRRSLKPHESASRFQSKLHLVVHILCRHSMRRTLGACSECGLANASFKCDDSIECPEFWLTQSTSTSKDRNHQLAVPRRHELSLGESSTESESAGSQRSKRSTNSILQRKGLPAFEEHIDDCHLLSMRLIAWLLKESSNESDRQLTPSIYACPMCDILKAWSESTNQGDSDDRPIGEKRVVQNQHFSTNAQLQAHVACYHAGARQMDQLLGTCQVCGPGMLLDRSVKHLYRAGHVQALKANYDRCTNQGRSCHLDFNWSTECLFCWQRFSVRALSTPANVVLATCRLQTHLVVQHTNWRRTGIGSEDRTGFPHRIQSGDGLAALRLLPICGWCGDSCGREQYLDHSDGEQVNAGAGPQQTNSTSTWSHLQKIFTWYQCHEEHHALGLASWWLQQTGCHGDADECKR